MEERASGQSQAVANASRKTWVGERLVPRQARKLYQKGDLAGFLSLAKAYPQALRIKLFDTLAAGPRGQLERAAGGPIVAEHLELLDMCVLDNRQAWLEALWETPARPTRDVDRACLMQTAVAVGFGGPLAFLLARDPSALHLDCLTTVEMRYRPLMAAVVKEDAGKLAAMLAVAKGMVDAGDVETERSWVEAWGKAANLSRDKPGGGHRELAAAFAANMPKKWAERVDLGSDGDSAARLEAPRMVQASERDGERAGVGQPEDAADAAAKRGARVDGGPLAEEDFALPVFARVLLAKMEEMRRESAEELARVRGQLAEQSGRMAAMEEELRMSGGRKPNRVSAPAKSEDVGKRSARPSPGVDPEGKAWSPFRR